MTRKIILSLGALFVFGPSLAIAVEICEPTPRTGTLWSSDWYRDQNHNRIDDEIEAFGQDGSIVLVDFFVTFAREQYDFERTRIVATLDSLGIDFGFSVQKDFSILPTVLITNGWLHYPICGEEGINDPTLRAILEESELNPIMIESVHALIPAGLDDYLVADAVRPQLWDVNAKGWPDIASTSGFPSLVAIVDSGIDHLGLDSLKFAAGYDAFDEIEMDPPDETAGVLWHGTRVAYAALGMPKPGFPFGVAPWSVFLDVDIAYPNAVLPVGIPTGFTTSDRILAAFEWIFDNRGRQWILPYRYPQYKFNRIDVVNVSYKDDGPIAHRFIQGYSGGLNVSDGTDNLSRAVDTLVVVGEIPVVVAAGNDGEDGPGFGGMAAAAFGVTVGGYRMNVPASPGDDDTLAFSNHGVDPLAALEKPDIVAPGANILDGAFGTSYSAAQVSGAVALMRSLYPVPSTPPTAAQLKQSLQASARPRFGQRGYDPFFGFGTMNVDEAVDSLATIMGRANP